MIHAEHRCNVLIMYGLFKEVYRLLMSCVLCVGSRIRPPGGQRRRESGVTARCHYGELLGLHGTMQPAIQGLHV